VPDNYIDPFEDSGLPGTNDLQAYSQKRATSVVQRHLQSMRGVLRTARTKKQMEDDLSSRDGSSAFSSSSDIRDIEEGMAEDESRGTSQGRILSSLLQLYGERSHVGFESTSTLPSSTSSRVSSPDEHEKLRPRKRMHSFVLVLHCLAIDSLLLRKGHK